MKTAIFAAIGRLGVPAAQNLIEQGWNVVVSYRAGRGSEKTVQQLMKQSKGNVLGVEAQISEKSEAELLAKSAMEKFGRIDALIAIASWYPANADWQRWEKGEGVTEDDWKYYRSNFVPIRNCAQAVLESKFTADDLCIINFVDARSMLYSDPNVADPYREIGGVAHAPIEEIQKIGLQQLAKVAPVRQVNPYTLSKRDIIYLTRQLALEQAGGKVRVNAIAPGPMLPPPDMTEEQSKPVVDQTLLKRWGHTEPITQAIDYLLQATFVTGEIHRVDGGFYLHQKFTK